MLLIVAIAVVAIGVLLAAAGIITAVLTRRNGESRRHIATETLGGGAMAAAKMPATQDPAARREEGRLVFVQEGRRRFELEDLLRASAEVLGSGDFGASYKTALVDGSSSMVVKRFKEMNGVGRRGFAEHMRRLGRLVHPNLLPVVAYLYNKDEKLFVTKHVANGSLAHLLHGGARSKLPPLDWPKRLSIIKGVARGLAHLHDELPMLAVPHGHLKSSNVLLDGDLEAVLSDYGLVPVITPQRAARVMVAYKSPDRGAGKKSDVWSLGILILEVLTGRFPANYLKQGRDAAADLAGWVNSVAREEWTGGEVFDRDMGGGARSGEGEMVKLLKVGLGCCEADVDRRLGIKDALDRIEELRDCDVDLDSSAASSYRTDGAAAQQQRSSQPPHFT